MVIPEPTHSQYILSWHVRKVQLRNTTNTSVLQSRQQVLDSHESAVTKENLYYTLKAENLQKEIEESELEIQ